MAATPGHLEGTGESGKIGNAALRVRIAAGVLVLTVMVWLAVSMIPPYIDNYKLQGYLDKAILRPEFSQLPPEYVSIQVAERANRMGIPVRPNDVNVSRINGVTRVQVKYVVMVEMILYTVRLHFHPAAHT